MIRELQVTVKDESSETEEKFHTFGDMVHIEQKSEFGGAAHISLTEREARFLKLFLNDVIIG